MAKFNTPRPARAVANSPFVTDAAPAGRNHQGGTGYGRDAKTELYFLGVAYFAAKSFYEGAEMREARFVELVREVAVADPKWMAGFVGWLRNDAGMRTAPIVAAAEAVHAMLEAGVPGSRPIVRSAIGRSDEPGEFLAYWHGHFGDNEPMPVKRGIADALNRVYSEYTLLKYDTGAHGYRFGDIVELVHPKPRLAGEQLEEILRDLPVEQLAAITVDGGLGMVADWEKRQGDLYEYALNRRHGRKNEIPASLAMVRASQLFNLRAAHYPRILLNTEALRDAGFTWENALSLAGSRVPKGELWTALIPLMGYDALLKNLRNFDQAGVSDAVAAKVAERLTDPAKVARAGLFPMRYLAAFRAVASLRWGHPLETAITLSLGNIPQLRGRTLVLVDTSNSMNAAFADDSTLRRWDAAALFGIAVGQRCEAADVVSFSGRYARSGLMTKVFPLLPAESLLRAVDRWKNGGWCLDLGTATAEAVLHHFDGHDRVVIVTDEQAGSNSVQVSATVPDRVPLYTWNLSGEKLGHGPSGTANRHTFAGLTDQAWSMIPLLESGRSQTWPWVGKAA